MISPTQYLILNENVNENDDVSDDDYNFFLKKKKKKKKQGFVGGGREIRDFGQNI